MRVPFAKGQGTQNDFVIVLDRGGTWPVTPKLVRAICRRHTGVGADGLLRAVKAKHMPAWDGDPGVWFMDHRNADGTTAEMCGNGLRVFARYLTEEGLVPGGTTSIATRAGLRVVQELRGGDLRAQMGEVRLGGDTWLRVGDLYFPAVSVDVGNPHAVAIVPGDTDLAGLDLRAAPGHDEALFPDGVNAEFVSLTAPGSFTVRVHERGVGETRSCGTGAVAAAAAVRAATGGDRFAVEARGGSLRVEFEGTQAYLTGPAVIVARGEMYVDA